MATEGLGIVDAVAATAAASLVIEASEGWAGSEQLELLIFGGMEDVGRWYATGEMKRWRDGGGWTVGVFY